MKEKASFIVEISMACLYEDMGGFCELARGSAISMFLVSEKARHISTLLVAEI
jgi:hypothetical protein